MLVSLELYIRSDRRFGFGRTGFWKTFEAARRGFRERDDRELPELTLEQMEEHEEAIRSRFPQELERYVNFFLPNVAVRTPDTVIAPIRIKCVAIQYGSIKPILDVVGVESADIRNFVLMALSVYAPTAFNEALHSQVDVEASEPNVLGEQRPVATSTSESINPTHQSIASRASDVATRAWTITNLTLVVPVALSLVVLYYAYTGLLHELEGIRTQAAEVKSERGELIKTLMEQNKALVALNAHQTMQMLANDKATQDALATILKGQSNSSAVAK